MSVIYEKELMLAKQDFIKDGNTIGMWRNMEKLSAMTINDCGFKSGYDVRRVADRYGKRVFK